MAEHHPQYGQHMQQRPTDAFKTDKTTGPSTSKVLALIALFPLGGFCLLLAGITLTGTLIGLAVATPVFVIFSPVLVPAALTIGLAVTGFLTSGAFGITALSSLSYIINYFRRMRGGGGSSITEPIDYAKRRAEDATGRPRFLPF